MQFLRVKNFEKYQQFKKKRPAWIKFYLSILRDPTIARLSLKARAVYFELLLLAAELENSIPLDYEYLKQSLMTRDSLKPILTELYKIGFVLVRENEVSSTSTSVSVSVSSDPILPNGVTQLSDCITTPKTQRKSAFPENWQIEPWMERLCTGLSLSAVSEFTQFKNYHLAKGTVFSSWPHAFRTWVANAVKYKERGATR